MSIRPALQAPVLRPVLYFAICFVFSWSAWIFPVLASRGVIHLAKGPMFWILVLGSFGPFVAAFVTLGIQGGWSAMKRFALRAVHVRVGMKYLLAAFLLVPLIGLAAALLHAVQGGAPFAFAVSLAHLPMLYVMLFFLGGSCGEEFGSLDGGRFGRRHMGMLAPSAEASWMSRNRPLA